ncbi:dimethylallyltransferase [Kitasatospora phosalacinea]|uniref:Dimethylallyltransferase n=1 Tax=Kitasatospora phosalacinea TaxID=2065 RepID=A0A9W6Q3Z6_9ACTN|nr:type 1 glutamine amidotransferase domain-containing protein [Kitasatospora phosalacinea]GLW67767.1 dimethylallyltransferase [Kitasatospora phosalacinea]
MTAVLDTLGAKRVLILASNPATSTVTGWPVGFWWSELTHPYWEFTQAGYQVEIVSPDGGPLTADGWSDPRDPSRYSAEDLLSLGFATSPEHAALLADTPSVDGVDVAGYDALLVIGGQGPMFTFVRDARVHALIAAFHEAGKVTAVLCHGTAALLHTRLPDGSLLVAGKTWTGFADAEEDYVDAYVGQRVQPFRIETEARALTGTNFVVAGPVRPHAVRDGLLVTGQQQYSGTAVARLVIEALGR